MASSTEHVAAAATVPAPLPAPALSRNVVWTFAGNAVYAASQWGILVAIAKLGTAEMVGQFALASAIAAPVFLLASLHLRAVQATDACHDYEFGHYLAVRWIGAVTALVIVIGVVAVSHYRAETAAVILIIAFAKAVESFSDVMYGLWQKWERLDAVALAVIGRGSCSLVAVAALLFITRSVAHAAAGLAFVWLAWLIFYERTVSRRLLQATGSNEVFAARWERRRVARLSLLALPLGLATALLSLNVNIPRYFVQHYLGEAALGYFAALSQLPLVGTALVTALGQAMMPRLSRHYQSDRPAFTRIIVEASAVAGVIGCAGVVLAVFFGRPILALIYSPEYARYHREFTWIMVAGAVSYLSSALGYAYTATRRYWSYVAPFSINILLGTAVAAFFVKSQGLMGAALTVLVISLGQFAAMVVLIKICISTKSAQHE